MLFVVVSECIQLGKSTVALWSSSPSNTSNCNAAHCNLSALRHPDSHSSASGKKSAGRSPALRWRGPLKDGGPSAIGRPGPGRQKENAGNARLHLSRMSAARKSVVAVAGEATRLLSGAALGRTSALQILNACRYRALAPSLAGFFIELGGGHAEREWLAAPRRGANHCLQ
jgi:hypothetical protein